MAGSSVSSPGDFYSKKVAFIYLFNLFVGAGALALPQVFALTGWILGIAGLAVLAFMSFVTSTFMVEAMSIANAIIRIKTAKRRDIMPEDPSTSSSSSSSDEEEEAQLLINTGLDQKRSVDLYEITKKVEMGQMAQMFFNKVGIVLYYIVIALYLYGDLAIYAAAVPKSLTNVTCHDLSSVGNKSRHTEEELCVKGLTAGQMYRIYLLVFTLTLGPFVFFNIQKTKYLQMVTTLMRWIAFLLTIGIAFYKIGQHDAGHYVEPASIRNFPNFFDRLVFPVLTIAPPICIAFGTQNVEFLVGVTRSFAGALMQYLVPATLVYLERKKVKEHVDVYITFLLMIGIALYKIGKHDGGHNIEPANISQLPNFFGVAVYSFMCQHSLPSILTPVKKKSKMTKLLFGDFFLVHGFYLLLVLSAIFCFQKKEIQDLYTLNFVNDWPGFAYFLALFPVFTLSSSFPIIGITLRENLKSIFYKDGKKYPFFVDRIVFPVVTIAPPIAIAFGTQNVELLVGVTGSYAGALIQYIIPVMLVYCGREQIRQHVDVYVSKHRSVFRQRSWIFFVVAWAVACILLVSADHIINLVKK